MNGVDEKYILNDATTQYKKWINHLVRKTLAIHSIIKSTKTITKIFNISKKKHIIFCPYFFITDSKTIESLGDQSPGLSRISPGTLLPSSE